MLKKLLKWLLIAVGGVAVLAGGFALFIHLRGIPSYPTQKINLRVESTPERIANGRKIVNLLCAECHFDQGTNRLTGKLMMDLPDIFGKAYSRNITQDPTFGIGAWTDGDIAFLLRTGIKKNGIYAPPWMPKFPLMADEDLHSVIAFLRSNDTIVQAAQVKDRESEPSFFAKFLCLVAFKPYEYPTTPIGKPLVSEKVAYGKYMATGVIGCFSCHSEDFAKMDELHPEKTVGFFGGGNKMADASGRTIYTPNITPDKETGIGNWTEAQFVQTMKTGIRVDRTPLRYPMARLAGLEDDEISAIWAYLQTVPVIHKARIHTQADELAANASEGEKIYTKYSCYSCHANTGNGVCDLTNAGAKYKTDEEMIAWIKDPSKTIPGSKMPTWDGTIQDNEYVPLCEYVRLLGEKAHAVAAR